MSTVKTNDLQNTSGGIPTVKGQRLIPTAWVNFNGTGTVAIRDSENVSSITDRGVGLFTLNFSSAMANTNYCIVTATENTPASSSNYSLMEAIDVARSILALPVLAQNLNGLESDRVVNCVTILGGQ